VENGNATIRLAKLSHTIVEGPITNHLRDYASNLEKYKVVQILPVYEDRNQEDCKFGNIIP
jgi:hypothetical protein